MLHYRETACFQACHRLWFGQCVPFSDTVFVADVAEFLYVACMFATEVVD